MRYKNKYMLEKISDKRKYIRCMRGTVLSFNDRMIRLSIRAADVINAKSRRNAAINARGRVLIISQYTLAVLI